MAKKVLGPTKRYGARYGKSVRERADKCERSARAKHDCPFCAAKGKVRRVFVGCWKCSRCEKVFVGKAYAP